MKAGAARTTLLIAGLCGLFLLTEWNWFGAPFERDEGEYAYSAWLMSHGGVPYRDAFLQKPPMILYTYWLAQRLSDSAVWPPRAFAAVFVLLTVGLLWWIARREYGPRCAWIGAWLFVPMLALPSLYASAANTEKFMILPMVATVALHAGTRGRRDLRAWLAAGATASLALLYKPICLPVLLFVFAAWSVDTARQNGWRAILPQALWTFVGGALTAAAALAWFADHHALGALWEATVAFNRSYAACYGWGPDAFLSQVGSMLQSWWPLALAAGWLLGERPGRAWYYAGLLLLALAVSYKDPNGHYYVTVVPFLALLAARGLDGIAGRLAAWRPRAWAPWLAGATAALLVVPVLPLALLSPSNLVARIYRGNPFVESAEVACRLAEVTRPGESVFIAGSEPQILFHAKRPSATRFVIMYPLMLPTPFAARYQDEVIQALRKASPEVMILSTSSCSWLAQPATPDRLITFLRNLWQTQYVAAGGYVWEDGRGRWEAPLEYLHREQASLILYRKVVSPASNRGAAPARR